VAEKMRKVVDKQAGETCIECHQGIAYRLPAGYDEDKGDDRDFSAVVRRARFGFIAAAARADLSTLRYWIRA
jgi:hypothetical protein